MNPLFQGKVALVTGASSGIGQAVAYSYAANGAKVILSDVRETETAALIKEGGGEASFVKADVSNAAECEQLIKKTIGIYGKIDIAFNNAGILGEANKLADMSPKGFEEVIGINLNSVFYCMKYEIEAMLKQGGGVIVNNSSILGAVGFASFSGYVAAQHGVIGLTQNAALEYSDKGIRINCLAPGFIDTPLLNIMDIKSKKVLSLKHPIGRLDTPDEVAALVIWLSCEKSSFTAGGYYPIDGTYLAS